MAKFLDKDHRLFRWFRQAQLAQSQERAEAVKCWNYYSGYQYTQAELDALARRGQPPIVINRIKSTIDYVIGVLAKNRLSINCIPRSDDDPQKAYLASQVLSYVQDINDFHAAQLKAFTDAIIGGIGWLEARRSFDITKDPIKLGWVDWREMYRDPMSKEANLSDARYVIRTKWVDVEDAEAIWPDSKKELEYAAATWSSPYDADSDVAEASFPQELWWDSTRRRVRIFEILYRQYEAKELILNGPNGEIFDPEDPRHVQLVQQGARIIKGKVPIVKQAFLAGPYLLEEVESPYKHPHFWYVPIIAYQDLDGQCYGIVRNLISPQDEINKRRSKAMHYLNSAQVLAEKGAISDPDLFVEELHRPDGFMTYNKGFAVEILRNLDLSAQHFQIMLEAGNEIDMISGVHKDARGEYTNARTGEAIRARQIGTQNILAPLFANMRSAIRLIGEITLSLVQQYYTDERVIRISGTDQTVTLNKRTVDEQGNVKFENTLFDLRADIVVGLQPATYTERQAMLSYMSEVLKAMPPQIGVMLLDMFVNMTDLPEKDEMVSRIRQIQQALIKGGQGNGSGS